MNSPAHTTLKLALAVAPDTVFEVFEAELNKIRKNDKFTAETEAGTNISVDIESVRVMVNLLLVFFALHGVINIGEADEGEATGQKVTEDA
ncbi:MAG: hypothetical protein MJH10_14475 [Epibacterium sp.]|nr:hypothetical protein [Epibacterium sp.]NQX74733.1 hypothetical protein [Epibacterium sp.]